MPNKIYIIGGARSGKSFLAEKLSEKIGITHYDLDDVVFQKPSFEERSINERDAELKKILDSERWIIEGAYAEDWTLSALQKADAIIWLNTSPIIKLGRFLKKTIQPGAGNRENIYGRGKLVIGLKHKQWDRSPSKYRNLLKSFDEKLRIIKSKRDIQNLLDAI